MSVSVKPDFDNETLTISKTVDGETVILMITQEELVEITTKKQLLALDWILKKAKDDPL